VSLQAFLAAVTGRTSGGSGMYRSSGAVWLVAAAAAAATLGALAGAGAHLLGAWRAG
jgi:hypothetical protein